MVECMVFGTRAQNSRYIHGTKTKHLIHTDPDCKNLQISSFFIVLEKNNRITEYSAQIKSKSDSASEFVPQLTQKSSKVKLQRA
jgi:hypothetical protein